MKNQKVLKTGQKLDLLDLFEKPPSYNIKNKLISILYMSFKEEEEQPQTPLQWKRMMWMRNYNDRIKANKIIWIKKSNIIYK
jgi:hypothetical protein